MNSENTEERLRKSEANLHFILENTDTAYILLDNAFNILSSNQRATLWSLGETGKKLIEGENFLNYLPGSYKTSGASIFQSAINGTPHRYEAPYIMRDKTIGWFNFRIAPVIDAEGIITGICVVANDVTERKQAEEEIKAMNNSLEKKVKERTAELENANKELEAFTYSVSHDLMAPLRIIDGFSQVLLDDYKNKLDEEGLQTINVIKRNATRMGELVNDLLNLTRLGRASLIKQKVDMNELVNTVIDEMRFTTNKLAAKIKLSPLKPAECDKVLIKQVWMNLLSNAIKYSGSRENPMIEIGCMEQNGQTVYFVKDNGVGFDLQYAGKLFGVFQRLHKAHEFPGTGVGLAIVHRIISRHRGRVWADAKLNDGAVFYFTLP